MSKNARSRVRIALATVVLAAGTVAGTGVAEAKAAPNGKDAAVHADAGKSQGSGLISTRGFRNR